MSPTDKSLLEELERELQGKPQRLMLAAYLKAPNTTSILAVAVKLIEKATPKHESK